jgi:hypothetical protein
VPPVAESPSPSPLLSSPPQAENAARASKEVRIIAEL